MFELIIYIVGSHKAVTMSDLPRFEVVQYINPQYPITLEISNPPRDIKGKGNKPGMARSKLIFIRRFFLYLHNIIVRDE